MEKENKKDLLFLIILLVLFTSYAVYLWMSHNIESERIEKEYYRDQMILFCKTSQVFLEDKYPDTYPCEKWLVGEDAK